MARVEAWEIDEMDILNARMLAMQRAIEGLSVRPDTAFIDGNRDHGSRYAIEMPHQLIVGGDGKSASIGGVILNESAGTGMCRESWTQNIPVPVR